MLFISEIVSGEPKSVRLDLRLLAGDIMKFKYALVTSCDMERSFSILKNKLSDRRHCLTAEHLKHLFMLYLRMDYKPEWIKINKFQAV